MLVRWAKLERFGLGRFVRICVGLVHITGNLAEAYVCQWQAQLDLLLGAVDEIGLAHLV